MICHRQLTTLFAIFAIGSVAAGGDHIVLPHQNELTNHIRTIPFEDVVKSESQDGFALFTPDRVTSPMAPVVVRQDDPTGPKYQEALGFTFLVNAAKFPGVGRFDNGRLLVTMGELTGGGTDRHGVITYSDDEGKTWSPPKRFPNYRTKPINLGGKRMLIGSELTEDNGETWHSIPLSLPHAPDGRSLNGADVSYSQLAEGNEITYLTWVEEPGGDNNWKVGKLATRAILMRYHLDTNKWDEPYFFPKEWAFNEGTLVRAKNGDLVASFRTQMLGVPMPAVNDSYMGLDTTVSTDNGKTWSEPAHHFLYGCHHSNLILLKDGRILMTYTARIGQLDDMTYHGIEAVVSSDNGRTWDWPHRCIIDRWGPGLPSSAQSVQLSDGRIFSTCMFDTSYTWSPDGKNQYTDGHNYCFIGRVPVIIWKLGS